MDHAVTDTKTTLLVTDRRLVLMSHDLFGQWQVRLVPFITRFGAPNSAVPFYIFFTGDESFNLKLGNRSIGATRGKN